MHKVLYYTHRLLALVPAVALLLASCSRSAGPQSRTSARAPQGDPVINVPLSINLGSPDNTNPLESFDGVAPEPGQNPVIFIAVVDVATHIIEFEKMIEFRQNNAQPWKYDSQEEIPLYGGRKDIYALYYPNLAGIHMGADGVYYFRPDAKKEASEGTRLSYTFIAKGGNPNVLHPSLNDFWIRGTDPRYDKFAGFPIVLHPSKTAGVNALVAYPMAGHKDQNTPMDAYNSWANDAGGGPSWRYQTTDYDTHPHRTGTGHGTGSPDAAVSFNETRKIRIGSYADMVALNNPAKPLNENYNYNGVYKLPHNALASSCTTVDVDALIAAHPSDTQFDVDIPLYRDYARVRIFIAKDKDNPRNVGAPNGPRQRIGLRGIGFISMPSVAAPSFRRSHGDPTTDLYSVSFNPAGARTYNDAYAVEFASGDLKYPELKAAPQGTNDDAVCEAMRANPQDYMFLLPQYIAPFDAPLLNEVDQSAVATLKSLIAIKDPSLSPHYASGFSRYKNCYWFSQVGSFYYPRILIATYYADRDASVYSTHKSMDDPYWTHWVPFGERLDGISTADVNPATNPLIRSLYSGDILPGHTYDVFIIVPTPEPEPDPSVTKQIKVIVKSWVQKTITIPDFE